MGGLLAGSGCALLGFGDVLLYPRVDGQNLHGRWEPGGLNLPQSASNWGRSQMLGVLWANW